MYIIGVDCAVSDEKTGLAQLSLKNNEVKLLKVKKGSKTESTLMILDQWISDITMSNEKVLVCFDSPLGWPISFGENIHQHMAGLGIDCQPDLFFRRRTDNVVYEILGKRPLDVTANFIARTAFHSLNIVNALRRKFDMKLLWEIKQLHNVGFIEVYPAAWLISEGIEHLNYKKNANARQEIVEELKTKVAMGIKEQKALIDSEHIIDATLSCMSGLDFIHHQCITPIHMGIEQQVVLREGWIWIKELKSTK